MFLKSVTYLTYYSLRTVFGILAAILLQPTGIFPDPMLLAFAAVIGAVSTLENFSLKIAGENIADLPSLFEGYRTTMIENHLKHASQKTMMQQMKLSHDLANRLSKESLRKHTLLCLHTLYRESAEKSKKVDGRIKEIDQAGGQDDTLSRMLLAAEIVYINLEYAQQLLSRVPSQQKKEGA